MPSPALVYEFLEKRLKELAAEGYLPDVLTYAGNGEPTLHPEFAEIVDGTIALRNKYAPEARVSVLSNASMLGNPKVVEALKKIDNNILKLDAGTEKMFRLINNPGPLFDFDRLLANLRQFNGKLIIQTMFLRGEYRGETVDNTTEDEVKAWISHLTEIRPSQVMIYPIARETPLQNLQKIGPEELEKIAGKARVAGIEVKVFT